MNNYIKSNEVSKKRINPFIVMGLVLSIILVALIFTAIDVKMSGNTAEAATQHATLSSWSTNTTYDGEAARSIELAKDKNLYNKKDKVTYNMSLTFSGNAGALYRNGAFKITYRVEFDSVTHKDYGGFSMSGPNMPTQTQGSKDGNWDIAKTSNVNAVGSGDGTTFKVDFSVWADDGTYWAFGTQHYNTDTDVTCRAYVRLSSADSTGPSSSISYVDDDQNTWKKEKRLLVKLTDKLAGVNPATIKVNGTSINIANYNGIEDGRDVEFYYTTSASTLTIEAKDYLGNGSSKDFNLTKIDPDNPTITTDLKAVGELGYTVWTNKDVTLTATAQDSLSGLKEFKVGNTTKTYSTPASQTGNTTVTSIIGTNGTYTGYAKDHANNTRNLTSISITKIDKVAPTLTYYVPEASKWKSDHVTIYLNVAGVSSNDDITGISPIRPTNPITIDTDDPPLHTPSIMPLVNSIDGFSYTHTCVLRKENGWIWYRFVAYDKAGNASNEVKFRPKIDTIRPNISSVSLSGKNANGESVNAALYYSYTNITVTVVCSDESSGKQGGSGIKSIILRYGTTTIAEDTENKTEYVFENVITMNTIQQNTYLIILEDHAGNIYQYDNGSGLENFREFKPLKDSETPDAKAIGSYDWQNADGVGQNIKAEVWVGLSGGKVEIRRTYLSGLDGRTIQTSVETIDNISVHTNLYSGGSRVYIETPIQNIRNEGEEYYHFRVTSNAGKSSDWRGLNGAVASTPTITKSGAIDNWVFSSNGARTRIDNTPPEIVKTVFTNGNVEVQKEKFEDMSNILAESIYAYYTINDGIKIGGSKTEGLNCSGMNSSDGSAVSYTITYGLTPSTVSLTQQIKYSAQCSKAEFHIIFSNQGLEYGDSPRFPTYTITITDRAGNSAIEIIQPYIDDQKPVLEIISCQEEVSEGVWEDYNYFEEQNWTKNPIVFTFNKNFGQGGAKLGWFIDCEKTTKNPDPASDDWYESTSATWGNITDTAIANTATIRIPLNNSFDAMIYFIIRSTAKDVYGNPSYHVLTSTVIGLDPVNFYIAVDNSPPDIVNYEFKDSYGKTVAPGEWSPTDVYLHINVTDVPTGTYTNEGSGIKDVKVNIRNTTTDIPMEIVGGNPNYWKSQNLIGSNQYIIQIEDNVGLKSSISEPRFRTFKPDIDKVDPTIDVTAGSYDSLRGTSLVVATPTKNEVYINVSTSTILSGANVYYSERSKTKFEQTRFNTSNINVNDVSQNWQLLDSADEDQQLTSYMTVGDFANAEVHYGYDFVIISGSGRMAHYEYGTIFVDRKAPQLIIEDIVYMRDGNVIDAGDIIVPTGVAGQWTNAPITAKLKVSDGTTGSGINPDRVTLNNEPCIYTEGLDSHNNGFYIFELTEYVEYELKYQDRAGNAGNHIFKPLIDNAPVSISLSAIDEMRTTYIIDPSQGVVYTNQTVKIAITINYGLSSFKNTVEPDAFGVYSKGVDELYTLSYSLNGTTWYDINVEMGTNNTWTNSAPYTDNSEFRFISHNLNSAQYEMYLTENQNRIYYFRVRNGVAPNNVYDSGPSPVAVPYFQTEENVPQIKIDKTPPIISDIQYVNAENDFETLRIDQWTYKDIRVYFRIEDNEYGSGVLENDPKSVIIVKRNTDINHSFIENIVPSKADGLYSFVMDGYYNYYIEYEDNIGNGKRTVPFYLNDGEAVGKDGGITGPINALIDKVVPNFISPITAEFNGQDYVQRGHPWTYHEVTLNFHTIVGLSGQNLQYAIKAYNTPDTEENWSSVWVNVVSENSQENGAVGAISGLDEKITRMIFNDKSDTYSYRFRVVSQAGLFCEVEVDGQILNHYKFGNILIDTIEPTINVSANYEANTWTKDDVEFEIEVTSGLSSSYVQVSNDNSTWLTSHDELGEVTLKETKVNNNIITRKYLLIRSADSTTANGDNYYFKVTSNAGREDFFNFGRVKKDERDLTVTPESKIVGEEDIQYDSGDINYAATYGKINEIHNFNNWASKYILIKLTVTAGYSGGFVSYCDDLELNIYKDTHTSPIIQSSGEAQEYYILIKEDQNKQYKFKATSNSGMVKESTLYNIKIDKTVPYMKLSISESARSTKWTNDLVDDLHKWYILEPTITFDVGQYIIDDNEEVFKYGYPISGATIYYQESYINEVGQRVVRTENNDGDIVTWFNDVIRNNGYSSQGIKPTMKIEQDSEEPKVRTYEFKIVTGAGLEFEIKTEYSDPANTTGKDLWTKSLTSDEPGTYTIKVDTNDYFIDVEQWLKEYRDGLNNLILPGVNEDDMAELVVFVNGVAKNRLDPDPQAPIKKATYKAKRGDNITVAIKEMPYDDVEGYGYIFKRVEFEGIELNAEGNEYLDDFYVIENGDMPAGEYGRTFEFDVFDKDYSIMGYFTKEIKVSYKNLNQIAQSQAEILAVEIESPNSVSALEFNIFYTGTSYYPFEVIYNDSENAPTEIGQYAIRVTLKNDNASDPNYLIHNGEGREERIVYFENKGTVSSPIYWVNNVVDLGYLNIYNDFDPKFDFLGAYHTMATYMQMTNLEIDDSYQPIYGTFTGIYDGNNRDIYSLGAINANGVFGIFESISGEVKNLGIRLPLLNITNTTNAGFLAGSATNATINNCYAIGEMHISGENANIGGLIGQANNETTMTFVYTDVAISNKGNALSGNVGGIVGLVDNIAIVYNYAIGAIEAYGVDGSQIYIGTLAGSILSTMEDGDFSNGNEFFYGNKYLLGNLFINENIEANGGVGYLDGSVLTSGTNEIEGLHFNRFVDPQAYLSIPNATNVANVPIASVSMESKYIRSLAIGRIRELGMEYGLGTMSDPFQVDSKDALAFIDKYVWATYIQTADILFGEDDLFETIAAHKVFSGEYNGFNSNTRYIIKGININTTDRNAGIFGKVAGTIKNLDVRDLDIVINYEGFDTAYAGGVTAILVPGAKLEMVYVVGNIVASSPNAKLYLGGITGYAEGASLTDILSMANVKTVVAQSLDIGGTAGYIKDAYDSQKIYSLARVEGNYNNTGSVGALAGTVVGTNDLRDAYALFGNTYAHGEGHDVLAGHMAGTGLQGELLSFEEMRGSGLTFKNDQQRNLDAVMRDVYPLSGNGTENNAFLIYTIEDFNMISNFLYANYKLKNDIVFDDNYELTKFHTIGVGARFTGSITGAMSSTEYQEYNNGEDGPRSFKLYGITDSLVYHNAGKILDLRITINYNKVHYTDVTFGAIAVYNSGTIQNINADGNVMLRVNGNANAVVGGFVGEDLGGKYNIHFEGQEPSYELSSINEINMTIMAGQINAGGFVGRISGPTTLSYLISEGSINCFGGSVLAGTIAGAVLNTGMTFENEIESTAIVKVNNIQTEQKYGFNINQ